MNGNRYLIVLLCTLLGLSMFATPSMAQTTTVVTFDNPAPPGSPNSLLNGAFQGIDFGTGRWRWAGPYGADPTNSVYFDSSVDTSRTFSFSPGPRILDSMNVYATADGTFTLADGVNEPVTRPVTTDSMQLVTTGWTQPSTSVMVTFTAGWSLGIDDITYRAAGPPDTMPPTVSLTSPADGDVVSGTIMVSASASDEVEVVGVQFLLNGANLGAEDTTAPYSISWDTTTVGNGSYTLAARARDAAGNRATSSAATVTVSNAGAPDPARVGQWAGPFSWPLVTVHMALLRTREVLVWDRAFNGGLSAQLWNPTTGTFIPVPNGFSNLFCAGHAFLADGRLLVVGGHVADFLGIDDANIFDPVSRTWTSAAPMAFARWYPTATTMPDGRVLVVSGSTTCSTCIADIPEIYDPDTNTWIELSGARLPTPPSPFPLYPFMFVLPDGRVLNAGSDEEPMMTRVLDLQTQTWTIVDPVVIEGGSAVMYSPGRVMKAGSASDVDRPSVAAVPDTYVLDMTQAVPAWRRTAPMAFPRGHHDLTLLPDGTVLVTGGGRTTDGVNLAQAVYEAEIWSPVAETWRTMARMQVPRLYHSTALLLADGRVLVAGGGRFGGRAGDQPNAEIYSPPYLFRGPRPVIAGVPTTIEYGTGFFVETPDASGTAMVSLVRPGAVTHSYDHDQRFLSLAFQQVPGGLIVQAPANANLAPPGYYMLFVINTDGVPSIASFVRLQDSQPPTVAVTSPASGSTVSGTITVSADASDNRRVAGVQFLLNGENLGAEDPTAPYSISWTSSPGHGDRLFTGYDPRPSPLRAISASRMAASSGCIRKNCRPSSGR